MKIILSGGGTLGPVVPLLAIAEAYRAQYPETQFIWVGTPRGPERELIQEHTIPFVTIGAGKWRRYFSLLNVFDIFRTFFAFFQAIVLIIKEKPALLISAGGFVSVPLHWAGALFGVPAWVHQQDIRLGLANKLMFPFATKITTAVRDSVGKLSEKKTEWLGNPVRDLSVVDKAVALKKFNIPSGAPVIFALGGGTGSSSVNNLIFETLSHLPQNWHVIHLTGKDRPDNQVRTMGNAFPHYHAFPFFTDQMKDAYALADIVVARAGFSTLTELAALSKAAVIMPMFGTHQEDNARTFADQGGIILIKRGDNTGTNLVTLLTSLMNNPAQRTALGHALHELLPAAKPEKIVAIIGQLVKR